MLKKTILSMAVATILCGTAVYAEEIQTSGVSKIPVVGDLNIIKAKAKNEAIKKAILNALNKTLGSDASKQSNITSKLDEIIEQIDQYMTDENVKSDIEGNEYVVKYNLTFDDQKFRKLLSDLGIAINTNSVRSSSILVLMDEYFTTPTDMKAPLEEVTTYSKDKSSTFKAGESNKSFDASAESSKFQNDTAVSASGKSQNSAFVGTNTYYGSGVGASSSKSSASMSAKDKSSGEQASASVSSAESSKYVDASQNDTEFFQKIVKYQPKSAAPEKQNGTLTALYHILGEYDIKHLDNDLFKSKYFGDKPITLEQLTNSAELSKYALAASEDQKADYFAIGSTIMVDKGKNERTGNFMCDGTIAMKVYATTGQAENISSGTLNETSTGGTPDQCKGNLGKKLAEGFGPILSRQIQEYYKKRMMYGKEYIVQLIGKFTLLQKNSFKKMVPGMDGVKNLKERSTKNGIPEYIVTYTGEDISGTITGDNTLINALNIVDAVISGNELKLCQTEGCK